MKKKNINLINYSLLTKSKTTPDDLRKLAKILGFNIDYIGFGYNFPEIKNNCKLCILNLGNDNIGGTHWVAVNNESKQYFDSLGVMAPYYIPKDYKNNDKYTIQNLDYGHCGQYSTLFLYYSNLNQTDEFYKLFKKGYYE